MILLAAWLAFAQAAAPRPPVEWFLKVEQAMMDAVALGNAGTWDQATDPSYILTTEEGQVMTKAELLKQVRPLPPGLKGTIVVRDLTVQDAGETAIVRYIADETETVFGQRLTTKYRVTDVFRGSAGAWKIIASHTSVITADPPAQDVSTAGWPGLAGTYRLLPDGWTFQVVFRDGRLFGGRDPAKLQPFVPMTPTAFVLSGSLGEWLFVVDQSGRGTRIVNLRKFEPLVWTRIDQ
jgi:hypothetical protein